MRPSRLLVPIWACAMLIVPASSGAATIAVNTTVDELDPVANESCSLREAVLSAGGDAPVGGCVGGTGTDTINLPPGFYLLTRTGIEPGYDAAVNDLDLQDPSAGEGVSVRGVGRRSVVIDANGIDRVFDTIDIDGISISGVTIQHGDPIGPGAGGAVRNDSSRLILRASTVRDNVTDSLGGGIVGVNNGAIVLENVTVSGNRAGESGGGVHINTAGHFLTVRSSTVTKNVAVADGLGGAGGGGISRVAGTVTLRNSIVAGNVDGAPAPAAPDCHGLIGSAGNNLIGSTGGCTFGAAGGDVINVDARLGPLAGNGGASLTHALLPGSRAINAAGSGCPLTDQRGLPRTLAAPCDIGAYERVLCRGVAVNRFGTAVGDVLTGTSRADGMLGFGGRDFLRGLGGDDALCGGKGRDRLIGGKRADKLLGGPGPDRLLGGAGRDLLLGGPGRDLLLGGKGADRLRGGPGRDRLRGGPGRDRQRQ